MQGYYCSVASSGARGFGAGLAVATTPVSVRGPAACTLPAAPPPRRPDCTRHHRRPRHLSSDHIDRYCTQPRHALHTCAPSLPATHDHTMRVCVVGAGTVGLHTALALQQRGHAVTVVAAEVEDTTSNGAGALWRPFHAGATPDDIIACVVGVGAVWGVGVVRGSVRGRCGRGRAVAAGCASGRQLHARCHTINPCCLRACVSVSLRVAGCVCACCACA